MAKTNPSALSNEEALLEALRQIRAAVSKRQLPITNQVFELADAALKAAGES